jgi:hypothetical protein
MRWWCRVGCSMFDDESLAECLKTLSDMTPEERQQRAQQLKLLLDEEMKRRKLEPETDKAKKLKMFEWLVSMSRKVH